MIQYCSGSQPKSPIVYLLWPVQQRCEFVLISINNIYRSKEGKILMNSQEKMEKSLKKHNIIAETYFLRLFIRPITLQPLPCVTIVK